MVIYWVLYSNLLYRYTLLSEFGSYLQLVPDAIILYLTFNHRRKFKGWYRKHLVGTPLYLIFVVLFVGGAYNALLNKVSPMTVVWGLRMVACSPLLFLLVVNFCDYSDIKRFKTLFYNAFNICLVFCFVQFLNGQTQDYMGGIFSGNGELAVFSVVIAVMSATDYFNKQISQRRMLFVIVGLFVIAVLAEIRFLYFITPLCFLFPFLLSKRISVFTIAICVIAIMLFIPVSQKVMSLYYDEEYAERTFNRDEMEEYNNKSYGFKKGGFNRGTALELTTSVILKDTPHILFGYGIGSGTASESFSGILYDSYKHTTYHFFSTSYILVELGWVGFVAFVVCVFLLLFRYYRFYFRYRKNLNVKIWSICGIVSALATFFIAYYNQTPYVRYYMVYMLWGIGFVAIKYEVFGPVCNMNMSEQKS